MDTFLPVAWVEWLKQTWLRNNTTQCPYCNSHNTHALQDNEVSDIWKPYKCEDCYAHFYYDAANDRSEQI